MDLRGKERIILIFHPNRIILGQLLRLIRGYGFATLGATRRPEAFRFLSDTKPDLFIIAPGSPDDLAIIDELRTSDPSIAILVLADTESTVQKAKDKGVEDVVVFDENDIGNILEPLMLSLPSEPTSQTKAETARVLIVDDDPDVTDMLTEFLLRQGYTVDVAENGEQALAVLENDGAIRVVLLDIKLPGIGGVETLKKIMHRRRPPAVVVISGISDAEIARYAVRLGAGEYVVKPIDLDRLDQAITICLARAEYRDLPWWDRHKA